MSGKLDQSLDEILSTQPRGGRGGRRSRPVRAKKATAPTAPAGGIQKKTRPAKGAANKPAPAAAASAVPGSQKIVVSNLPKDVTEAQIKEYFMKAVGSVKKVELSYGPNGASRGIASIIFARADAAANAFKTQNGLLVDNKPMRIELVMNASAVGSLPGPKALSERVAQPKGQPKPQPKSAAAAKPAAAATRGGKTRGARGGRGGRPARQARPKKTAEELDSEMADYFEGGNAPASNENNAAPATAAAPNGDDVMGEVE